ncbi:hypothetical protein DV092_03680 [Clostridium botulinum]|uniref:hypothetical protein n=1 Tax=Clostridium sp. ZBS20 TaxID=2949966 RepID=UPI002079A8CA|nr:hypothetical protein [Clostridium sp. ZBS20]MBN1051158.1 hypothetical protein [Clostridium botulinum]
MNDGLIDKVKDETGYNIILENFLNRKEKLAILLGRRFNQIQRINMVKNLSKIFNFHVYGDENWNNLNDSNIIYKGYAEHFCEMPNVFKFSKININCTRVYVESGLLMRVFDISGSKK